MSADLHTEGWRQGSIVSCDLEATYLTTADSALARIVRCSFSRWIVCTQDCDLKAASLDSEEFVIELRPVLTECPPADWGIRSRRLLLNGNSYVDAHSPRCLVTPALLFSLGAKRENALDDDRCTAFKTWLGRRYDRPAIPEHLVDLAKEVAKRCKSRSGRAVGEQVHDILMQFHEESDPVQVALFGVIADDADADSVRTWIAEAATRINPRLGVVAKIDVGTRSETSLHLVETSYAADLSQLTWGGEPR